VEHRHPFRFATAYRLPALALGITPVTAMVHVSPDDLTVRFGLWRLTTPRSNIAGAELTGGFSFLKTVGPPHLSFADRGVTFATNGESALCLEFHEPVQVLDPSGRLRHPGATLTVADPVWLATDLGLPV
jgi:hypothetical protein